MIIHIVNGPNLNLVGKREPEIYGNVSLDDHLGKLTAEFSDQVNIKLFQSNSEGVLLDYLQEVGFDESVRIIINAGALGHTSLALGDCIRAITAPVIDVHISNVLARESFRQNSFVTPAAVGSISGLGLEGYRLAIDWFLRQ
ncbi:MAG: type II 3-dehydroquinate dehydratase [Saprospiraceae bacterium]